MSTYKTRPVGEIFKYWKVKLQIVENETCEGCFFWANKSCHNFIKETGYCGYGTREDHKNVIFKRIDK